jgi:hypothetical protein
MLCLMPLRGSFLVLEKKACREQSLTLESLGKQLDSHWKHSQGCPPGEAGRSHLQRSSSYFSIKKKVKKQLSVFKCLKNIFM